MMLIRWGIPPNIEWVYVWLFSTDEPVDAETLSEELHMSRGAGGAPTRESP
jgi:DNA-binding transcriptional regulator GbsR (MarR family)